MQNIPETNLKFPI